MTEVLRSAVGRQLRVDRARHVSPGRRERLHDAGFANRVSLPGPAVLAEYWRGRCDIALSVVQWIAEGLIDTISGDDVPFLTGFVEPAGRTG
jgi:hypothetical protein